MSRPAAILFGALLATLLTTWPPGPGYALESARQSIRNDGETHSVRVPIGYRLELLTRRLDGPRLFTFAANGDLLLGSKSGHVYRLPPPYSRPEVLVSLPDYPHSVALRDGEIFIAQSSGLYRAPYRTGQARLDPDALSLLAALPGGGGHSSRTVRVGPDQRVYVSLGISGNCSDEYLDASYPFNQRRGGVLVLDDNDAQPRLQPFATGPVSYTHLTLPTMQ